MLIAQVEMDGVWSVDGGMHAVARAIADLAARTRRDAALSGRTARRSSSATGGPAACGSPAARRSDADAVVFNGDVDALAQGLLGAPARGAVRPVRPAERSLSAITWLAHARTAGFELAHHNVFFHDDYASEFADIFGRGRLPAKGPVYVCAPDRGDAARRVGRPSGCRCLVNAPAVGDRAPRGGHLDDSEIEQCEQTSFALLARCGLTMERIARRMVRVTPRDFHRCFRRRAARCTDQRRTGGCRRFAGASSARSALPGLYLAGGQRASGTGRADGGDVGAAGGRDAAGAPRFDQPVPPSGYLWWYLDALSDDGRHGLTVIAFVGSVFSPYYGWATRRGIADAEDHCAFNVALYGVAGKRWTMTERGRSSVVRSAREFVVGPSSMAWRDDHLELDLDEVCVPVPHRVRGRVRVFPAGLSTFVAPLDDAGRHRWGPIAACARVEVDLERPGARWSGHGYLDSNEGDEPISRPFAEWDWSRASLRDGSTAVLYDVRQKQGGDRVLALRFAPTGEAEPFDPPARQALPRTRWRIGRTIRSDPGTQASVSATLEDTPFYVRSVLESGLLGERVISMHETLNVPRLASTAVQLMLPFRMPRRR